jgi:hypothetical protein
MTANSKLVLGPEAVQEFLDAQRANEYGPTPDDFPTGPFIAIATMDAPAGEEGEVEDFEVIGLLGRKIDLSGFESEFMSPFQGQVVMTGEEYVPSDTAHVLFRIDDDGDVTAVFPFEEGSPGMMTCYAHVGQHSSCDIGWLQETRAATEEEYASLKRELEGAPFTYKLIVLKDLHSLEMEEPEPASLAI